KRPSFPVLKVSEALVSAVIRAPEAIRWLEYSDGPVKTAMPWGYSRSEKEREALAEGMRTQDHSACLVYCIFPTHRRLRLQSTLYARGLLNLPPIDRSVQSWVGHATHAATYGLRRSVFSAIALRRTPVLSADSVVVHVSL